MSASINLLDKYKKACSLASDNACAGSLGVGRAAVSKWRNGTGHPEADLVERMCDVAGEPLAKWLPLIEAERARTPSARKVWLRLAQVAAGFALVVGLSPVHAEAVHHAAQVSAESAPVYIMRNKRWWSRGRLRLGMALAWLLSPTHGKHPWHDAATA